MLEQHTIYTIGHSTHSEIEFLNMLKSLEIKILVDIRRLPGSRKFPQFDKENLKKSLEENGIQYMHMTDLGGRRKAKKDSNNNRWHNNSFKGYADYMETEKFKLAIVKLEYVASGQTLAYMCAEAVWWRCHRSMVSDYLKTNGWEILHIMGVGKTKEHLYTSPAKIINNHLSYSDQD